MVRHVGHDRVAAAEEAQLEAEGGLVVEQQLPPVARDRLREDDQDFVFGQIHPELPEISVKPLLQGRAAQQVGAPDALLLRIQPPGA